jgi:hypothetical protein
MAVGLPHYEEALVQSSKDLEADMSWEDYTPTRGVLRSTGSIAMDKEAGTAKSFCLRRGFERDGGDGRR